MHTETFTGAAGFTAGTLDGVVVGGGEPAEATFSSLVVDGDGALPLLQVKDAFVQTYTTDDGAFVDTITSGVEAHVQTITTGDGASVEINTNGVGANVSTVTTGVDAFVRTLTNGVGAFVYTNTIGVGAYVSTHTSNEGAFVNTSTFGAGAHVRTITEGVGAFVRTHTDGIDSNIEFNARKSEFKVEALNGISLDLLGPDATTVAYVARPTNSFAVEKSKLGNGATAADIAENRLFAVSGTGATQVSIDTIDLLPTTALDIPKDGAEARRVTIINGDKLLGAPAGNFTLDLADGVNGQLKTFTIGAISDFAATLVITPDNASFATATLIINARDSVTLVYTTKWNVISGKVTDNGP
jgi:hypothetical protein